MARYIIETDQGKFEIEVDEGGRSIPATAASLVTPPEPQSLLSKAKSLPGKAVDYLKRYSPFPTSGTGAGLKEFAQRLFHPVAGQTGPLRAAEEAGATVERAVIPAAEKIVMEQTAPADSYDHNSTLKQFAPYAQAALATPALVGVELTAGTLRPSSMQQMLGAEGMGVAAKLVNPTLINAVKALDKKVLAPLQQFLTGVPAKEWTALSKDPSVLLPKAMGGPPSKQAAGEAINRAKTKAGVYQKLAPAPEGYARSTMETLSKGESPQFLSQEKNIRALLDAMSPQEVNDFNMALKSKMKAWVPGKDEVDFRTYAIWKKATDDYMGSVSKGIRSAQKKYAGAAQRSKFTSLFPLTKYGQPSIGRTGFLGMVLGGRAPHASDVARTLALPMGATAPIVNAAARAGTTVEGKAALAAAEGPIAARGLQAASPLNRIRVRNKQTGETGTVSEQYFNPDKYERLE